MSTAPVCLHNWFFFLCSYGFAWFFHNYSDPCVGIEKCLVCPYFDMSALCLANSSY
ncbi:hypothetical protein AAZX31_04G046900 [Glycine max]|uniref:Uncharacterized protein n=1 Tax=Glycine max TaxID=3847 RepID=K7KI43_SOYBN|nr:hypothetical protein JHK85_009332 [Glycine max]KAH1109801.1 hypothetical protein GYH30_008950 [Glycine max]KRH61446.1 hypothetical protein GLYMA_04G047600v4 [Glycine max]